MQRRVLNLYLSKAQKGCHSDRVRLPPVPIRYIYSETPIVYYPTPRLCNNKNSFSQRLLTKPRNLLLHTNITISSHHITTLSKPGSKFPSRVSCLAPVKIHIIISCTHLRAQVMEHKSWSFLRSRSPTFCPYTYLRSACGGSSPSPR